MKIALIVFVSIAIFDSVITKSTELRIEPKTEPTKVNETYILASEKTETSHLQQNVTQPSHDSTNLELNVKNRRMPKMQIKVTTTHNRRLSYVLTTRRPIMGNRKFTSKPHAVHYIHSQTQSEQSNFSKKRNLNAKRFKPHNKNNTTFNISKETGSVEDRFKNFTDIGDSKELGHNKGKFNTNRQTSRRRGYNLATAASEPFKSVAFHLLPNSTKVHSKSKLAIQESLQKIRRIRPGMKGKTITTTDATIKIKQSFDNSGTNNTEKNSISTDITSEKSVPLANTTEKLAYSANIAEKLVNLASTKKTLDGFVTVSENLIHPSTAIEKLHSLIKTEKPFDSMTIVGLDNAENKIEKAALSENTVEKLNNHKNNTENLSAMTTENLNNHSYSTETPIFSTTSTEKFNNFIILAAKSVDEIKSLGNSYSGTEKSEPLVIVTALSLSETNGTIEAITNNNLEETLDPHNFTIKREDNIVTMTPLPNGNEVTATEGIQHLALRHKRRINVIEEEGVATTSNGFRLSERGSPIIDVDVTFRNIHT